MDAYIFRAKTKKVFDEEDWYNNKDISEVWYTRKFWDLIHNVSFIKDTEKDCGEFIKLTKDNIEEMIHIATHWRDYWGGFDSVPQLCEILDNFDDDAENGWNYYFEFDY